MKISKFVPAFLKPALGSIYRRFFLKPDHGSKKSRESLHAYWTDPYDGENPPEAYAVNHDSSELLVDLANKYSSADSRFLEIGCNVGRNLNYLHSAGYKNLNAVEINPNAVKLLKETFPDMAKSATIHNAPVENVIKTFGDDEFDVVYSLAVLEHIHKDSEWIFGEMVRISKQYIITIEDEHGRSWRHFPRNYKKVFTSIGMQQIEERHCKDINTLDENFFARVFRKKV